MAIRRTREEKIQIQQRREQEKFTWKDEPSVAAEPTSKKSPVSRKKTLSLDKEHHWLRQDLLQTVVSVLVVLALLAYFYWRSL